MTIQDAIKKAIKGGYKTDGTFYYNNGDTNDRIDIWQVILLDPLFWQSLGKAKGWDKKIHFQFFEYRYFDKREKEAPLNQGDIPEFFYHWHRFIDHLTAGKSIESFFEELK